MQKKCLDGWGIELIKKIVLFDDSLKRYIWRKKDRFEQSNIVPFIEHGGGFIIFWGFVAAGGIENTMKMEGRMLTYLRN